MDDRAIFEETYPKYAFSELVLIGLAVGAWILRVRRRAEHIEAPPTSPADKALAGPTP